MFGQIARAARYAAAVFLLSARSAQSAVVYDWTGTCNLSCAGTATAVLTLADTYVPGAAMALSDFLSFSYSSSNASYDVPGDTTIQFVQGSLPNGVGTGLAVLLDFLAAGTSFFTNDPGLWISDFPGIGNGSGDQHQWSLRRPVSAVPLPAPAWMFLSTLLAVGLFGWWRRRRLAATA